MKTKNRVTLILIVSLLVILAILSSRMVFANANLQDIQGFQTIQRPTATPMSRALLEIQSLEHDLQYGNNDDYTRRNLQFLLTQTWKEATQEIEKKMITLPPYNISKYTPTPLSMTSIFYLGIQNDPFYGPGSVYGGANGSFIINNLWRGLNDGENIFIYAGCLTENPDQGIIFIRTDKNGHVNITGEVRTDKQSGCLTIVEDVGNGKKLILQAKNGDTYYFDIPGRTFVQSLYVVAPTITPRPTDVILPPATPTVTHPYPPPLDQLQAYPIPIPVLPNAIQAYPNP
jgi:hypothetical protein